MVALAGRSVLFELGQPFPGPAIAKGGVDRWTGITAVAEWYIGCSNRPDMNTLLQDLRVAVRQLARQRSFTLIVVVTLALGIGATTTCFALLNAVAFRPIPFADPDRLVGVNQSVRREGRSRLSLGAFTEMQQARGIFVGFRRSR